MQTEKTAICILGMHRSGTSVVTRALNLIGVSLGDTEDLVQPNPENPDGFWENSKIVEINERILSHFSTSWDNLKALPNDWVLDPYVVSLKEEIKNAIEEQLNGVEIFAWKDPRTCLVIPFWQDVFQEIGLSVKYIIVFRHPLDVANSLNRRNGFSQSKALGLWTLYNILSLKNSNQYSKSIIFYDDFLENPASTLMRVVEDLHLSLYLSKREIEMRISGAVKVGLRHSNIGKSDVYNQGLPDLTGQLFGFLMMATENINVMNDTGLLHVNDFYNSFSDLLLMSGERSDMFPSFKIQLFWPTSEGLTELNSKSIPGIADGETRMFELSFPNSAYGWVRLDPLDITGLVDVLFIECYAMEADGQRTSIKRWNSKNLISDLEVDENVLILPVQGSLKLLCLTSDPRLVLRGVPIWEGELILSITGSVQTLTSDNVRQLARVYENEMKSKYVLKQQVGFLNQLIEEETAKGLKLSAEIEQQKESVTLLEEKLMKVNKQNQELFQKFDAMSLKLKVNVEEKNKELLALKADLNSINRDFDQVINSHGHRVLVSYYRLRDYLFPNNSIKRSALKLLFRMALDYRNIRHLLTKDAFKKFGFYVRTGGIGSAIQRTESKLESVADVNTLGDDSLSNGKAFLDALTRTRIPTYCGEIVDVVIPVYNAYDYTVRCINRVLENTESDFNLIIINDASTDSRISDFLNEVSKITNAHLKSITIINNDQNLGFIRSVNKAFSITKNDLVLLNTDTEVPRDWLSRLMEPLANSSVASVTPFSNSATTCSFPNFCEDNELPSGLTIDELDDVFRQYGLHDPIELPSGVGFCMALSRLALDQIGLLDSETFGKGYGEENDWCMRAHKQGYKNVLATNLIVYHKHGVSFRQHQDVAREERIKLNLDKLSKRHPEYIPWVHKFIAEDPIKQIRNLLKTIVNSRLECEKPGILFINHSMGGGTKVYQETYIRDIANTHRVYSLTIQGDFLELVDHAFSHVKYSFRFTELSTDLLKSMSNSLGLNSLYINQLVSFPALDFMNIIKQSGIPYTYFIHDYYCVCPSYNLLNVDYEYCGNETDLEKCEMCLKKGLVTEPWVQLRAKNIDIGAWRMDFSDFLRNATQVIAPSLAAAEIVKKHYNDLNIDILAHKLPMGLVPTFQDDFPMRTELNIACIGALGEPKGSRIIYELKELIGANGIPINLKVIGVTPDHQAPFISDDGRFEVTGRYDGTTISRILEEHSIGLVLISSVWPETFSYTAHEALMSGYPVVCFGLGAPAEKIKELDGGWVVEDISSASVYDVIKDLEADRRKILRKAMNLSVRTPHFSD